MRTLCVALAVLAANSLCAATTEAPLVRERTIPLDKVSGRIDHMAVDVAGKRLFVAELGNDTVDVVDLQASKAAERIRGLKEPQGVAYIPGQYLIVVANASDGSVRFFRAAGLSSLGTVPLGDDADNVRIDSPIGHVLVGYGSGGLAVIDSATRSKIGDIKLTGHPESFQVDPKTNRVFVNIPNEHQIAVVSARTSGSRLGKSPVSVRTSPWCSPVQVGRWVLRSPAKSPSWTRPWAR
jgi:DNA-binding beta-propeller fold protein YncE